MENPQIEIVHNPKRPDMPEYLRHGEYLVVAIQDGEMIAICAFDKRSDAKARAGSERRNNSRMGTVRYASGFYIIG